MRYVRIGVTRGTHSKLQIKKIAASIKQFGFTNPILVSDDYEIVAGHGRFEAAKLVGLAGVPVVRLSHLTEDERRAYVLADKGATRRDCSPQHESSPLELRSSRIFSLLPPSLRCTG